MTKKQLLKNFVELFNNGSHQAYEETRSIAVMIGGNVQITCPNDPTRFYHMVDAVRISQGLNLSIYAKCENNEISIMVF